MQGLHFDFNSPLGDGGDQVQDLRAKLDGAQLTNQSTGEIIGRVPDDPGIWVPASVEYKEIIDGDGLLVYSGVLSQGGPHSWPGWTHREDTSGLLDQFIGLADATPKRICAFAQKWGPLYKCSTHLPRAFWNDAVGDHCWQNSASPNACRWEGVDVLSDWRVQSARARATLLAAALLYQGQRIKEELWRDICCGSVAEAKCWAELDPELHGPILASYVNGWRREFTQPPTIAVGLDMKLLITYGFGFLPAAWVQLSQAVTRQYGLCICTGCGRPYTRPRKPQVGRDNYCPDCGPEAAKRTWRREHSREGSRA